MIEMRRYDVIVIGAGHAGCEAALAAARMGVSTLLLTMNADSVAQMSCNPAIGGSAKGQIVREIDALGGEMAKVTDRTGIQFRMLNTTKGPAVWAPRAQADKKQYQWAMKHVIESQPNLDLIQGEVKKILTKDNRVEGVITSLSSVYRAHSIIITTGTFLNGLIHIGDVSFGGGRIGDKSSVGISASLAELGFEITRLKTGTPCRLNGRTIDYSRLEVQHGDTDPQPFSYSTDKITQSQIPCHMTYTSEKTHSIIRENLHLSPLYSGKISSRGPRYCPSIEDKVVRFADKSRHQVFLEPEGKNTNEVYVNGLSTSLPQDVQIRMIRSIEGLENAELMRFGYAVEYDFVQPTQLKASLETKSVENLYLAGQINGTSGYEEAACQGLIAGINATLKIKGMDPFILGRDQAYIGVLIDDLITKGTFEPYRMFTSRAEHRLILRQDNADIRLMDYGHIFGLISVQQHSNFSKERDVLKNLESRTKIMRINNNSVYHYIKRNDSDISMVADLLEKDGVRRHITHKFVFDVKYSGYVERENATIQRSRNFDHKKIPLDIDYLNLNGLSREAQEKLHKIKPHSVGQAARISGLSPCDISTLLIHLKKTTSQN